MPVQNDLAAQTNHSHAQHLHVSGFLNPAAGLQPQWGKNNLHNPCLALPLGSSEGAFASSMHMHLPEQPPLKHHLAPEVSPILDCTQRTKMAVCHL